MLYKFRAYGHPDILATHKTTLEFTKDKWLTLKGDCIVGVNADFNLTKIKQFIKKVKNKNITIIIQTTNANKKIKETITAQINPDFNDNNEMVIRKTNFNSERTLAIKANKAAFGLSRNLIGFLKRKNSEISIILEDRSK